MVLDDIKTILGVTDKDNLLNLYIRKANILINNYLNISVDAPTLYPDAVIEYVIICYNRKGNEGVTEYKFENIDVTYNDEGLSKSVKDLLPPPYLKMRGGLV